MYRDIQNLNWKTLEWNPNLRNWTPEWTGIYQNGAGMDRNMHIFQIASYEEMDPHRQKDHMSKFSKFGYVSLK